MTSTSGPASTGRLVCPKCGANNFNTQAACWQCGTGLRGSGAPGPVMRAADAPGVPSPTPLPLPQVRPDSVPSDPAVAVWAAILLALFFPYVAVPVGIVFLMLDDRRKAEIGRIALVAGIVFTVAQSLVMTFFIKAAWDQVRGLIGPGAGAAIERIQQDRQPKLTDQLPEGFPTP